MRPHLRRRGVEIMADAAAVFFLSEAYRTQVFDKYIPEDYRERIGGKTYIIPNGIDDFWFRNPPETEKLLDKKPIRLVYAGRIDKNKNIPTIQKAMELLRSDGCETALTVVGRVADKGEFQKIQKDTCTRCLPAMPKEKLIQVYRESDIFVMPSFTESFGLVYAEAMSQGLPVIYSKGQGFDGQFPEGTVGYAVCADDPGDVAAGIRRVVDAYPEIQRNTVSSAKAFQWEKIIQNYHGVYQRVRQDRREQE